MPLSERAAARLEELLAAPNVVGYAAEPVVSAAGGEAIRVYLAEAAPVDAEIDGVAVEALVVGRPDPAGTAAGAVVDPRTKVRPLVGGVSIGGRATGTLGYFVHRDGDLCLLSSSHVLAPSPPAVLQPGAADGGTPADLAAILVVSVEDPAAGVAAGAAKLAPGVEATFALNGIGRVGGTAAAALGARVLKSGRTSGVTAGVVDGTQVKIEIGAATFAHQLAVVGTSGPFAAAGDSGSLVVDDRTRAVGLVLGSTPRIAFVNPIELVLARLGATLA